MFVEIVPIQGGEGACVVTNRLSGVEFTPFAVVAHAVDVLAAGDVGLTRHQSAICVLAHTNGVRDFDPLHCVHIHA